MHNRLTAYSSSGSNCLCCMVGFTVEKMLKSEMLKLLRQTGGFVSGKRLSDELNISGADVRKTVRQLESEGYIIRTVWNKGYYLEEVPDALSKKRLEDAINCNWAGRSIYYYPVTDSTNIRIKQLAEAGAVHGTLAVADKQEAGKGRRGRSWYSDAGTGVWMSILLRPQLKPEQASMITLVAAMAVSAAVKEVSGLSAGIKWPNDIVSGGKKVCGILTEMSIEACCISYVVCGIGINVNHKEFPKDISSTATSLAAECGKNINRAELIALVWKYYEEYYEEFCKSGDMGPLAERYNNMLVNKGQSVRVLDPKGEWSGKALGINNNGRLLVKKANGDICEVYSGEVSVRGIYGYI